MRFSASWFPDNSLADWTLDGVEIIIENYLMSTYEKIIDKGLFISAHSPMNVIIGSKKANVRYVSTSTICNHLKILHKLQPNETSRIVVHAASFSGRTPSEVWEVQRKTLWSLYYKMKDANLLDNSLICIENLGKTGQVGDLDDIIKLCNLTDNFIPCIDFGHLYGRSLGKFLNSKEDFIEVFNKLYAGLPAWKVNCMHIHFSKLLYTDKGEKAHTNFHNREAGPKPGHFIRALCSLSSDFDPVIVCESTDALGDGLALQQQYYSRLNIH